MILQIFKKHLRDKTFFIAFVNYCMVRLDRWAFVNFLNFDAYYGLQKRLGFPIQKLLFYRSNGYWPNLKKPKSFNEKCLYMKLFSRNPILPMISDKYAVREYVSKIVGEDLLIPLLQVVDRPEDICLEGLPDEFIVKTNFSSGQNIIVSRGGGCETRDAIVSKISRWMKMKYRIQELIWFPQKIERKIIVEKLIRDQDGNLPKDYKFYVFGGRVGFVNVISERFGDKKMTFFDKEWNVVKFKKNGLRFDSSIKKPRKLKEMVEIAEKLGQKFDFMRVDLYNIGETIYFGELTSYPGNAISPFYPRKYDFDFGNCWELDLTYVNS